MGHLFNVPLELFSREGLSYIASAIGNPLTMDSVTASKSRLEFAKLCVEIGVNDDIPKSIEVILGNGQTTTVFVEVPWLPNCCLKCNKFRHTDKACLAPKDTAPATNLQIWRKKRDSHPAVHSNIPSSSSPQVPLSPYSKRKNDNSSNGKEPLTETDCLSDPAAKIAQSASIPVSNKDNSSSTIPPSDSVATEDISCPLPDSNADCKSLLPHNDNTVPDHNVKNVFPHSIYEDVNSSLFSHLNVSEEQTVSPTGNAAKASNKINKKNSRSAALGVALLIKDLKAKKKEHLDKSNCVSDKNKVLQRASLYKVEVLCLLETRVKPEKFEDIINLKFSTWNYFTNYDHASNGRIWFLWKKGLDLSLCHVTAQCITAKIIRNGVPCFISAIYGNNDGTQRKLLWQHLKDLDSSIGSFPCILGGDFNIFLYSVESSDHDTLGSYTSNEMKDFQDTIHDLLLQDHPFFDPTFTWSNKQKDSYLARKLDRVLVNSYWVSFFQNSFVEFLAPGPSDHCMALVWLNKDSQTNRPKPFKFFNFWTRNPNFISEVQNSWLQPMQGNPMVSLFLKLKNLKTCLRKLNKDCYINISDRVKQNKIDLEHIQLSTLNRTSTIDSELTIQSELSSLEHIENLFLKQKAKIQWLKESDKCSKYFHSVIASKNKRETIRVLVNDQGSRLEYFDDMASEVIHFFNNQLGKANMNVLNNLLRINLSPEGLADLEKNIIDEEIKEAFFSQGNDKAPRPDGFTPFFFKTTWSVVGDDVLKAVKYFFQNSWVLPAFNSTIIALVPKITNPRKIKDYRPISCCSMVYKAITKILVQRLKNLLPDLITLNQTAFVKGRNIIDNTLLAQDLVKGYGRNSISPRCAIKIDLQKAFDSLDWDFLSSILNAIGLPPIFISWIQACYYGARYSISFNGSLIGYFKGKRGLRQGDPLSLILFVLAMNILSKLLNLAAIKSLFGYHPKSGISPRNLEVIKTSTGFKIGLLPVRYLGVPLVPRKLTIKDFYPLIDKIKSRIHQWSGRYLSYAGRLKLIKIVLQNIANFWCRQFLLPQYVINRINQLCSRYLWKGSDTSASGARVSWINLCKPKSEGGLGLKDLKSCNKVCMILLIRNLLAGQGSLWIAWTYSYVIKNNDFSQMSPSASSSYIFNKLIKLKDEAIPIFNAGNTTTKGIWEEVRHKHDKVPWHKLIRFPLHIPKFSVITWLAILDRLPTRDKLLRMGLTTVGYCVFCNDALETRNHLFADCIVITSLWNGILQLSLLSVPHMPWEIKLAWGASTWKGKSLLTSIMKTASCAFIYKVWEERNCRIFRGKFRTIEDLLGSIKETVGLHHMNRDFNKLDNVNMLLCNNWNIA
ncbi:uncharacterized protein LOC120155005 [Hibiscus syriacus]|uniref:uncharacterized protein LOC120155005 n=1 Tax=Hibiscus syriacus TaxID=106335 RepID=UPI0019221922|nr:uncharacterized protein LOC120155005 [Hibiscus syriacus]